MKSSSDRFEPTSQCPGCDNASWTKYLSNRDRLHPERATEEYNLYRCNECHLVKILPEHSPDEIKTFYPSDYMAYDPPKKIERTKFRQRLREGILAEELGYPFRPIQVPVITSLLKGRFHDVPKYVPDGRALDIGAGSGKYLNRLKALGWETYGIEMNEKAYETLVQQGHKGYLGMIEEVELPEAYFDFASLSEVIEHMRRPKEALKKVYACLKTGGCVFLSTPNMSSVFAKLMGAYWYPLDTPRHLQLFNPRNLRMLLESCGFILEQCHIHQPVDRISHSLIYMSEESVKWTERKTRLLEKLVTIPALLVSLTGLGDAMYVKARKH
jgi:2-polyprenyl-3-methyl-5-hydroxy-6-metoxy-1,4-benzoquinol methylase